MNSAQMSGSVGGKKNGLGLLQLEVELTSVDVWSTAQDNYESAGKERQEPSEGCEELTNARKKTIAVTDFMKAKRDCASKKASAGAFLSLSHCHGA